MATKRIMRALIVIDNVDEGERLRAIVSRNGLECASTDVVRHDVAAERASRISPDLIVVRLPDEEKRGLRTLRAVSRTVPSHICAIGSAADAQFILNCVQEGAAEFVDALRVENDLSAAIVRWKSRVTRPKSSFGGRVISVIAPSGGSGASTIAVNVAAALAKEHGEVGLIDLRLETGDLAAFLDLMPQYTFADLSRNISRMDSTMLEMALDKHRSGVRLLAAPRDFSEMKSVSAAAVRQTTALARRRFPYLVVDLENTYSEEQIEVLWQSDAILMVVRLDYTSLRNAQRALGHIEELGLDPALVKLVANRYGERKQLSISQAQEVLEREISYFVPDDPRNVNRAINEGIPVVLQRPLSKVARSLSKLASGVNGQHR